MCYDVKLSPFPPPDVRVDTSGHGACSRSPCGCACPNLVKVCWLEKRSFTQRTGVLLSPLLCPSCPVCQRCWQWDALASAVHSADLVLISCFLCFLLPFFFLLLFLLHFFSLCFIPFSCPFSPFCGFVSFHQVSKWLYWWSLSNLRYGQFLPYVHFFFCLSVLHAGAAVLWAPCYSVIVDALLLVLTDATSYVIPFGDQLTLHASCFTDGFPI